jgi:hypothetical protein
MNVDEIDLDFTKLELQVFALWADWNRDDVATEGWLGDPRGLEAYRRAFDKLDNAAWGGSKDNPTIESEPPEAKPQPRGAVAYRVRRIEGRGAEGIEQACNELAREGWRLVTASTVAAVVPDVHTYLFFWREVADLEIARAARQIATMATH